MKIVVLAGGLSTERDVSLVSGGKILKALQDAGHKAVLVDVFMGIETSDADKVFADCDKYSAQVGNITGTEPDIDAVKRKRGGDPNVFFGPNVIEICRAADVVFMALHGENGENGKVQAAFDLYGIRYTGTDYFSSAIAMDKSMSKELFRLHGINTPEGYTLKKGAQDTHTPKYPVVVKVTDGGSSVGVYIVHNDSEYAEAVKNAFKYGNELIVEQYIKGREFSVGVIDGKALPVIEIAPKGVFYDYKTKYEEGSAIETCPAELGEDESARMRGMAEDVFKALRLSQYARMDFMMDETGEMYCLEANTLPGMTPTSLVPQEAAALGMSFTDLCEKIIALAMNK